MATKEFYTIPEVAVILGVPYLKALRLTKQKKIKVSKFLIKKRIKYLVKKENLLKYIEETVKVKG